MKHVSLKLCCREGSAFGNVSSEAIDLFFISKHDMIYSQHFIFSTGAERASSISTLIIPLQDEININDRVADCTVSYNGGIIIGAKTVTELWF